MNRRTLLTASGGVLVAAALGRWDRGVLAQHEPESADLFSLLPQINLAIDDTAIPTPDHVNAGVYSFEVTNVGRNGLHFAVVRLPDDVSNRTAIADLADPRETPTWFDLDSIPALGNPDAPAPGASARGIVSVPAGRWMLLDPVDGRTPAIWSVTSENPARSWGEFDAAAAVRVGLMEMDFTGLDKPVPAGQQLWKIANTGTTAHEFIVVPLPTGTTKETLVAMVQSAEQGGDMSWFVPAGAQGLTSKGTASWQLFDLPAGTYGAMCLTPGPGGASHASMGMARIFTAV